VGGPEPGISARKKADGNTRRREKSAPRGAKVEAATECREHQQTGKRGAHGIGGPTQYRVGGAEKKMSPSQEAEEKACRTRVEKKSYRHRRKRRNPAARGRRRDRTGSIDSPGRGRGRDRGNAKRATEPVDPQRGAKPRETPPGPRCAGQVAAEPHLSNTRRMNAKAEGQSVAPPRRKRQAGGGQRNEAEAAGRRGWRAGSGAATQEGDRSGHAKTRAGRGHAGPARASAQTSGGARRPVRLTAPVRGRAGRVRGRSTRRLSAL